MVDLAFADLDRVRPEGDGVLPEAGQDRVELFVGYEECDVAFVDAVGGDQVVGEVDADVVDVLTCVNRP
ncbi:hypothetical protein ACFY1A_43790 [Streptomyces sp. NPDC001520]|uniref:hypothetical protein n=1 Tax=Streptomyces sp. NPDC001520 TaxID=3364581 RepID=UPI0036CD0508